MKWMTGESAPSTRFWRMCAAQFSSPWRTCENAEGYVVVPGNIINGADRSASAGCPSGLIAEQLAEIVSRRKKVDDHPFYLPWRSRAHHIHNVAYKADGLAPDLLRFSLRSLKAGRSSVPRHAAFPGRACVLLLNCVGTPWISTSAHPTGPEH